MQNIKRSLATGLTASVIALGTAGAVQAASVTTVLEGNLGLGINVVPGKTAEDTLYPYVVYTKVDAIPDYTEYPVNVPLLTQFPPSNQDLLGLPDAGKNTYSIVTNPLLDPSAPSAPGWLVSTDIKGEFYFTDRFVGIPGREDPDFEIGPPVEFEISFTSPAFGFGASANDLASDPSITSYAPDFYSAFWRATLFQVSLVDEGDQSAFLDFTPFSEAAAVTPGLAGFAANNGLRWLFDVDNKDEAVLLDADGEFRFALFGLQGIDALNALWAALGFGPSDAFSPENANDVPTGIRYEMTMTLTAIPLPAGLPLMLGALGVLGVAGWKRRRALAAG